MSLVPPRRWLMSQQWSTLTGTQGMPALPFLPGWSSMATLTSRWVAGAQGQKDMGILPH